MEKLFSSFRTNAQRLFSTSARGRRLKGMSSSKGSLPISSFMTNSHMARQRALKS